jgi:hypothetical protein
MVCDRMEISASTPRLPTVNVGKRLPYPVNLSVGAHSGMWTPHDLMDKQSAIATP